MIFFFDKIYMIFVILLVSLLKKSIFCYNIKVHNIYFFFWQSAQYLLSIPIILIQIKLLFIIYTR